MILVTTKNMKDDNGNWLPAKPMELNVKFNLYAIEQFSVIKGSFSSPAADTARILWGGYCGYCFQNSVDPVITFAELLDWIDENLDNEDALKEVAAIRGQFQTSTAYERLIKRATARANDDKKKASQPTPDGIPSMPNSADGVTG